MKEEGAKMMKRLIWLIFPLLFLLSIPARAQEPIIVSPLFGWDATIDEIAAFHAKDDPTITEDYVSVDFRDGEYGPYVRNIHYNFRDGEKLSTVIVEYGSEDDFAALTEGILGELTQAYGKSYSTQIFHSFYTRSMLIQFLPFDWGDGGGTVHLLCFPPTDAISLEGKTLTDRPLDFSIEGNTICGMPLISMQEYIIHIFGANEAEISEDGSATWVYAGHDQESNAAEISMKFDADGLDYMSYAIRLEADSPAYLALLDTIGGLEKISWYESPGAILETRVGDSFIIETWDSAVYASTYDMRMLDAAGHRMIYIEITPLPLVNVFGLDDTMLESLQIAAETAEGYLDGSVDSAEATSRLAHTL